MSAAGRDRQPCLGTALGTGAPSPAYSGSGGRSLGLSYTRFKSWLCHLVAETLGPLGCFRGGCEASGGDTGAQPGPLEPCVLLSACSAGSGPAPTLSPGPSLSSLSAWIKREVSANQLPSAQDHGELISVRVARYEVWCSCLTWPALFQP